MAKRRLVRERGRGTDHSGFALSFAAYTLGRQLLLRLRAETRRTSIRGPIIAALAGVVLVVSITALVIRLP